MTDVLPITGEENISGLTSLQFIPVSFVQSIPRPWKDEVNTAVSLVPGKQFFRLAFTRETASFNCPNEESVNGSVHKLSISLTVPKMKMATSANFTEMKDDLFIVIATDNNGNKRLCGTLEAPLRFNYTEFSQSEFGKRGGYTVTFFRDLSASPPYYTA